jgi:hypothetical protein
MGDILKENQADLSASEIRTTNRIDFSDYQGNFLSISIKSIITVLYTLTALFVVLSLAGQIYRFYFNNGEERYLTRMLNLDDEINFPTYFSSFLLLCSSVTFLLIAVVKRKIKDKFSLNWYILSFIFLFMSMDEILSLHEQFSAPIRGVMHTSGFFYFAWLVPAIISLLVFIVFNIKFFFNMSRKFQKLFFSSAMIYLFGAFGMEMIGGQFLSSYGQDNFGYAIITTIEETLELSGLILLLYTLLLFIKSELPNLSLKLDK